MMALRSRRLTLRNSGIKLSPSSVLIICVFICGIASAQTPRFPGKAEAVTAESLPFTQDELVSIALSLTRDYLAAFQHPKTHVLYGSRLVSKDNWASPADVKAKKPHPWGYGSRIADTSLHCGHMLASLLDAYEGRADPFLSDNIKKLFTALKFIGSVCPVEGLVPRGPHPDDNTAYYDDSSMDQHTTYVISLARYANSSLSTDDEKKWIRNRLQKIGERLEKNGWGIMRADGVTRSHVGFSWLGLNSQHSSILMPVLLSLYHGTGNRHWLELFNKKGQEKNGRRWAMLSPGDHIKLNAHPIYANQGNFRLNAMFGFLDDVKRQETIGKLMERSARIQLGRKFPNDFLKRFHPQEHFQELATACRWEGDTLSGATEAWRRFQPAFLQFKGRLRDLAILTHVRFPLGGFHMAMCSEDKDLICRHLPDIWQMLNTVEWKSIDAAETRYLAAAVALELYNFYFRNLKTADVSDKEGHPENAFGEALRMVSDLGIGRAMDATVEGNALYVIGQRALHVADISAPASPRIIGKLRGLGNVRQIEIKGGTAYITAREDGMFIVDVKNPRLPVVLRHYDTIELATGIALSGDVAFVACRTAGVELVDVSEPESPIHLSTVRTGEAQSVVARNGYLYAGVWGTRQLVICDVRNPRQPSVISKFPLDGFGDGVDVRGNYCFVTTGHHARRKAKEKKDSTHGRGHGLEIIDVSDPAKPAFVSRVKFPPLYSIGMDMWSVTVAGDFAFVADTFNGVFVVDVSEKTRPHVVAHRQLPLVEAKKQHSPVGGLALAKDTIYAAGAWSDLHVIDAANLARSSEPEPDRASRIPVAPEAESDPRFRAYRPEGQVHAVGFAGDTALVAAGTAGLHAVELWPEIRKLKVYKTEGIIRDVKVRGDWAYAAEGKGGLSIWKIEGEGNLTLTSRYRAGNSPVKQVVVPASGEYAFLHVGANALHFVDITEPASPKRVLKDSRHGLLYGNQITDGLLEGRYACCFWHVTGFYWYDLQAGDIPAYTGNNYRFRVGAQNGMALLKEDSLVTNRNGKYFILGRKETRSPDDLPQYGVKGHGLSGKPTVHGNKLYVSNRFTGSVSEVNITDIRKPKLLRHLQLPEHPGIVVVHKNKPVIPAGYQGLLIWE